MDRRTFLARTSAAGLAILITPEGLVLSREQAGAASSFAEAFLHPPSAAKPRVLWFWMNGNVTRDGITQDLEAMARIGVGGVLNFDAGTLIPQGPVVYLGPEWLELKAHAAREAERLGLDFTMHNCPGWSSSGGPWITPELGMQQLVWSETIVSGGSHVRVRLPRPFARLDHYKDVAVVACPTLPGEAPLDQIVARATAGEAAIDVQQLAGEAGVDVRPPSSGSPGTLVLELREVNDITSMSFVRTSLEKESPRGEGQPAQLQLSVSDDGTSFRTATTIDPSGLGGAPGALVLAIFAPVRGKFLRLQVPGGAHLAQLRLSSFAQITDWAKKANVAFGVDGPVATAMSASAASIVPRDKVLDLTSHVNADGDLEWDAPEGKWTILRFGHTALGTLNRSAPDTGIGLECDKYRKAAIEFHFDRMMEHLLPVLGPLAAKGRVGLEIDSYEVGMQNWTPEFPREFANRRGYDPLPFLPAMTGRIVGSGDESDRFLWDVRRAQADLIAANYYGRFVELCHAHGIVAYIEPYDRGPMEELQIGSHADIPLCEFWFGLSSIFQNNWTMRRTPKLAASIAHANGKAIVAAESSTGEPESARWQEHPFAMKVLGDRMFTQGVNRIVFHRFAHQPHPTALPGMTMGPWGIHFDRTTTWFEQASGWMSYLARCQALLQAGQFAADLAYIADEDANRYTVVERDRLEPRPPEGYDYDVIDAETVIGRLANDRAAPSRVTLPDGTSYSVLVLQRRTAISLALLRKLRDLVAGGVVLVGSRPERSLGLHGGAGEDAEIRRITGEMWGAIDGTAVTEHQLERGRVIWGRPLTDVLASLSLPPDFESTSRSGDAPLVTIHRRLLHVGRDADVYFVSNQRRTREDVVCTFRVAGRQPELWDPVTGAQSPCAVFSVEGNRTHVPLQLGPSGSAFIVFREPASSRSVSAITKNGAPAISARPLPAKTRTLHTDLTGTFTMALWAKPENHVMLATNGFMEHVKDPWTDGYAVYPPPGEALYGAGHATAGITVGRNGVAIWEHASRVPVFRFAAETALSGWTHVAVVYREGEPTIYVNGRFSGRGTRGPWTVHPGVGESFLREGASYYQGDMTVPTVVAGALDEAHLRPLVSAGPQRPTTTPLVEVVSSPAGALRFWADGIYQVQTGPGRSKSVRVDGAGRVTRVIGPWDVRFPRGLGAPDLVRLDALKSLHLLDNPKLRYFSGTATWSATFEPPPIASSRIRVLLDLGDVEVMAAVRVNGHDLGTVWTRPFQVDVTDVLKKGSNTLDVAVTNLWPNRLIGDEQSPDPDRFVMGVPAGAFSPLVNGSIQELPDWYKRGLPKPDDGRVTFTTWKHYTKSSPLLASGLIGPVALWTAEVRRP